MSQLEPLTLEFRARYHEIDPMGATRLPVILSWLQDAGGTHAKQLGVSLKELHKIGLTWVLSRLNLQMIRYPGYNEPIAVQTWPATREGLFSIRDYRLYDRNSQIIAMASSSWAALDLKTRRPVKLNDHLPDYPLRQERAIEDRFDTLPLLDGCHTSLQLPVLRSDLDQNQHVNNTVYAAWAMEAVPSSIADHYRPSSIEIGFRAEALYGDKINSCCAPTEDDPHTLIHRIEKADDARELARLKTFWRPSAELIRPGRQQ